MSRSQNSFMKKQREKKKKKKQQEKWEKKQQRKENSTGGNLEDMIAYVDEFGNITSEPPSEESEEKDPAKDKNDQNKEH